MTDILSLSIRELAEHFRRRTLSPVELLTATLARADSVQLALNPFRLIDREAARSPLRLVRDVGQKAPRSHLWTAFPFRSRITKLWQASRALRAASLPRTTRS